MLEPGNPASAADSVLSCKKNLRLRADTVVVLEVKNIPRASEKLEQLWQRTYLRAIGVELLRADHESKIAPLGAPLSP